MALRAIIMLYRISASVLRTSLISTNLKQVLYRALYELKNNNKMLSKPGTLYKPHIYSYNYNYNLLLNHTLDITSRINTKLVTTYPPPALKYSENIFNDILP